MSAALSAAGARGWGQSRRGCRTTSSEGVPRGRQGRGGASEGSKEPPRDRRRHGRCAPSPRGLGSWHLSRDPAPHRTAPHAWEASFLGPTGKAAPPTLLPLLGLFPGSSEAKAGSCPDHLPGRVLWRERLSKLLAQGPQRSYLSLGPRPLPVQKPIPERKGTLEGALPPQRSGQPSINALFRKLAISPLLGPLY